MDVLVDLLQSQHKSKTSISSINPWFEQLNRRLEHLCRHDTNNAHHTVRLIGQNANCQPHINIKEMQNISTF